jgi:transcription-repair coupling factor (superfamily II helicase)
MNGTAPIPPAPLAGLARRVAEDDALLAVTGRKQASLAVTASARPPVLAALVERTTRLPILVAVPTANDAETLGADLASWLGADRVAVLPAWETLPFERVSPQVDTMSRRLEIMWRLRHDRDGLDVVVTPARALVQRLGPQAATVAPVVIRHGDMIDRDELVRSLVTAGYRRECQVEHRGELAVRGSIVDVFPPTADVPVRIDLWGDEVDRLGEFAVDDQRSLSDLAEVRIFPAHELLLDDAVRARAESLVVTEPWGREQWERIAEGQVFEGMESWLPWLCAETNSIVDLVVGSGGDSGMLVLCEPRRLRDRAADVIAEERDLAATLATSWGADGRSVPPLHLDVDELLGATDAPLLTFDLTPDGPTGAQVRSEAWRPAAGDGELIVGQIRDLLRKGTRVVLAAERPESVERLQQILHTHGFRFDFVEPGTVRSSGDGGSLVVAPLSAGVVLPDAGLAILAESDLTNRRQARRPQRRRGGAVRVVFESLEPGSYVVHDTHGIARYGGMVTRTLGGYERDYLLLEYRGDDRLYVPSDQVDSLHVYSGGDTPRLSKMGGSEFARTKAAARAEVDAIAQELVVLYQRRKHAKGIEFSPDTAWQHELEEAFPYVETDDQLRAIEDVKADMEAAAPMDRLVCGDVGFGKTEVAIRAAFKAVQDGRQVAILVPTTLLAQQHFQNFSERFEGFPVRVEVLSRFLTASQARKVVTDLAVGEVDVVIGTHRLLGKDVSFKKLGLLIVDEEQRFGVNHKESIKALATEVDVLTLSATPIPRTLEMSLAGIRDLSLLNTPPAERQPILTYVGEEDDRVISEAIRRELLREGQVFFVHNRVKDIEHVAARVRELVPEARIAIGHGQMDETQLEQVVYDFWEGRYDVLVCTTIIESGIDMPTVNTLIVDRADLLGLGQLHQLRGRVGRAGSRAYAYLLHPRDRSLTEEAYERLKTIGESTELGSGFRIAMRDLEIRGAGNLLGTGQSGHVASVGYDLYMQMVNEAIAELNGEPAAPETTLRIELPVDGHLPADYVTREDVRLDAYRRLGEVATLADVADIEAEWADRFGPVPPSAQALLAIARVRASCVRAGVTDVVATTTSGLGAPQTLVRLSPLVLRTSKEMRLQRLHPRTVIKRDQREVQIHTPAGPAMCDALVAFFDEFVPAD